MGKDSYQRETEENTNSLKKLTQQLTRQIRYMNWFQIVKKISTQKATKLEILFQHTLPQKCELEGVLKVSKKQPTYWQNFWKITSVRMKELPKKNQIRIRQKEERIPPISQKEIEFTINGYICSKRAPCYHLMNGHLQTTNKEAI